MTDRAPAEAVREGVPTWVELLTHVASQLRLAGRDNADQEARWLVERAGGFDAAGLQLALRQAVPHGSAELLREMVDRVVASEPLQYVLGRWSFRSLELQVDQRVLIPRPETELLVEAALAECDRLGAKIAVDLGTGSGAIALSLLVERPGLEVWATDVSSDALSVASANLADVGHAADRGHLARGAWFDALPEGLRGKVDVVASNPPYVAEPEMTELPSEVREWEPHEALVSGPAGLDDLAAIVAAAPDWLARPGALLCEMAPHQTHTVEAMARDAGFTSVSIWPDLAGRDRTLRARL